MKRGFIFGLILMGVIWAHERPATAVVPKTDLSARYTHVMTVAAARLTRTAANRGAAARTPAASAVRKTETTADNGVMRFYQYVLNMSDPASLALLGTGLLALVGIGRRLPALFDQRQQSMLKIKNLLQVVSGFLF